METEIMETPEEYARHLVIFSAGNEAAALRKFLHAVAHEPSFKLAPASWLAAVVDEIKKTEGPTQ